MEKTINLKMTESQANTFEGLLDKTIEVLQRLETESPKRQAKINVSQENTEKIKSEIYQQLNILENKIGKFQTP